MRFFRWQIESRLKREVVFNWISGTKLVVQRGMTGATGNIYCGLHEYEDMAFVLHVLRPGDVFVDVGANIGSYTVLASGVCGARTIAIEPDPKTAAHLQRNIDENGCGELATVARTAVGDKVGEISFTVGQDTTNQVATSADTEVQTVPLSTLDMILKDESPSVIKMDVEGFETKALQGAMSVLAKQSLFAIQLETVDEEARGLLADAGFTQFFYVPSKRSIFKAQSGRGSNSLFVRQAPMVIDRLTATPERHFYGKSI
jgi:FkbM family methyltransferase